MTLYFVDIISGDVHEELTNRKLWTVVQSMYPELINTHCICEGITYQDIIDNKDRFRDFLSMNDFEGDELSFLENVLYTAERKSAVVYIPIVSKDVIEKYEARFSEEEHEKFFKFVAEEMKTFNISFEELVIKVTKNMLEV